MCFFVTLFRLEYACEQNKVTYPLFYCDGSCRSQIVFDDAGNFQYGAFGAPFWPKVLVSAGTQKTIA